MTNVILIGRDGTEQRTDLCGIPETRRPPTTNGSWMSRRPVSASPVFGACPAQCGPPSQQRARYLGWLCLAGEQYRDANRWFSRSLEWAIEAEDDDLAATVWSFKGHLAWTMGQVGPTVGPTRVARRYRGIYVGQTAYDAPQQARGHAATGDFYQV